MHGAVWIWEMTLFIHRLHLELGNRICGLPGRLIPRLHLKSQLPRSILDEAIRRLELPDSRSEGREGSLKLRITPLQSSLRPFEFLQAGAQLSFCSSRNNPASISAHFTNLESWKIITRQVQWSKFVPSFLGPPSPLHHLLSPARHSCRGTAPRSSQAPHNEPPAAHFPRPDRPPSFSATSEAFLAPRPFLLNG